jgi:hypothetical protein
MKTTKYHENTLMPFEHAIYKQRICVAETSAKKKHVQHHTSTDAGGIIKTHRNSVGVVAMHVRDESASPKNSKWDG